MYSPCCQAFVQSFLNFPNSFCTVVPYIFFTNQIDTDATYVWSTLASDSETFGENSEKFGKIKKNSGQFRKIQENSGENRKNWKIFFSESFLTSPVP